MKHHTNAVIELSFNMKKAALPKSSGYLYQASTIWVAAHNHGQRSCSA